MFVVDTFLRIIHVLAIEDIDVFKHLFSLGCRAFWVKSDGFHICFHSTFEVTLPAKVIAEPVIICGCHFVNVFVKTNLLPTKAIQQTSSKFLSYIKIVLLKSAHATKECA